MRVSAGVVIGIVVWFGVYGSENNDSEKKLTKLDQRLFEKALKKNVWQWPLKKLLKKKADPNAQQDRGGFKVTPFHCLFFGKDFEIKQPNGDHVKLLLEYKADPNRIIYCTENRNRNISPLIKIITASYITDKDKIFLIKLLTEYKADFNKKAVAVTPFYSLIEQGGICSLPLIQYALEHDADPNVHDDYIESPFIAFLSLNIPDEEKTNGINIFLHYKADPEIRKSNNLPVILMALKNYYTFVPKKVAFLLEQGLLNPCIWYYSPLYPPRWSSKRNQDGALLFEMMRDRTTRNSLVNAIPDWIKKHIFFRLITFLLCIKHMQKQLKQVIPRPVVNGLIIQKYIFDYKVAEILARTMEKIETKEYWTTTEGGAIKDYVAKLIEHYEQTLG